ncbi:acetyl/propionyl/methylcrotonyl-CoA carboxylase subunit alpha [Arthrobacter cupressi]|uniref:biotin carboxylase n=1 Tax=Arthrobacter cupressi TaxID=1045773 RepID=A0A1G8RTM3_9MICC|nr:biotin carboxylase N-terminal domain-containing protein [Arthrobacter cupressi]NYD79316.1 acetyl-CoA/propionyl-CoA carboxylase biotin carboxyl carrier protein [Arthrobacter cupressi]SDJ20318.1 acetyl-CoA/propionyl-CoA carboxylase, biotin carboxylase, biotin carboxyl carrier protein [Arthrobacter cupressi]
MAQLFDTVLVANRGEIACRVIRTLKVMGIRSVAVYSDADAGARHVCEADTAVRIGTASAADSYLNIDAIIDACVQSGAQAVHPGYGFLAENAEFAKSLNSHGIAFIGPPADAIELMGDKIRAKNQVAGYGVPCVPGIAEPGLGDAELIAAAPSVGFPLLIKPSAGGGGKGMHVVENEGGMPAALATARRVAAAAFGDDTLFLERLVRAPRHIEVQVLADQAGNVIHLGERECSLQRRHQKVIEEAPSPLLESVPDGAAIRARIGEAACQAARSVNYSGAGTVEFLVSDEDPGQFYFMEMNTRLQVEHPVTEMVTGIDLVEWQVRIAAGEELALEQAGVVLDGHAVEARVYAEDPARNFLPSAGEVLALDEDGDGSSLSAAGTRVRIDSAMLPGLVVTGDYDPMLSKVIAWGPGREAALDALDAALGKYTLLGLHTNVEYLRLLLNDPDVRAGRLDTGLIERKLPAMQFRQPGDTELLAAARLAAGGERPASGVPPWQASDGWRLGAPAPRRVHLAVPERAPDGGPSGERLVTVKLLSSDSVPHQFVTALETAPPSGPRGLWLGDGGWSCRLEILDRETRLHRLLAGIQREDGAADPEVRSPMPGTVVSVSVRDGDTVEAGQLLLSVEAMKMEHQLTAALAGTVRLTAGAGDLVKAEQVLATIHPNEETDTTLKGEEPRHARL